MHACINQNVRLNFGESTTSVLWFSLAVIYSYDPTVVINNSRLFHLIIRHLNHPKSLTSRKYPIGVGVGLSVWTTEHVNHCKPFQTNLSKVCLTRHGWQNLQDKTAPTE
ncbi:hypothetical protein L6164_012511 [Bauhinia variegata]|uniref:Uncharacterized protein n=1 Tax=Bauhinia variegata TaxID=167791 RepID=A0ACB9PA68_BAUVA|nr:hypothetical protein L6164_012511 [Bauhinia variegata]